MLRSDVILHDFNPAMARLAAAVDPVNFSSVLEQIRADAADARADAAESLIPARNVEQIMAEVLRDEFGPRYAAKFIPIGSYGVDPWADKFIQRRLTRQGLLGYVLSADMPTGDVSAQEIPHKLYTLGGKSEMSWFEQQTANYANIDVWSEKLAERREAAEDTKDTILINGDAALQKSGFIAFGLINHPDVPLAALTTGTWSTATAAEIIADVQGLIVLHRTQSRRLFPPDTLLLPEAQYAILESTQVPNTNMTMRSWLLANIAGLTTIESLPELAGAGVGGADRLILYSKSDRVLRGIVPMDFTFIAEEMSKLRTYIWGVMRMVGLVIIKPFAMAYADGI